jgi:hypothetical protein
VARVERKHLMPRMAHLLVVLAVCTPLSVSATFVRAQELLNPKLKDLHLTPAYCLAPCFDYNVGVELEFDGLSTSGEEPGSTYSLYPTIEPILVLAPVDHFRIVGDFVFEPVLDETLGQNYVFDNLGAYVYALFGQFEFGAVNVQVGKIHPPFGEAFNYLPGLFASDISGSYEIEERIGVNAAYDFDLFAMDTVLQASAFTTDRTILSGSIINHRPRTRLSDGGAGNTAGISSFAVTLDGCSGASALECYGIGDWGYQVAALYQRAGQGGVDEDGDPIESFDERGLAASLNRSLPLGRNTLTLFGEAAYFDGFEGSSENAAFATASAELEVDPVTYSLVYGYQKNLGSRVVDQAIEVALSYDLGQYVQFGNEEWSIDAAYAFNRSQEDGTDSHLFGVVLTVDFNGSIP